MNRLRPSFRWGVFLFTTGAAKAAFAVGSFSIPTTADFMRACLFFGAVVLVYWMALRWCIAHFRARLIQPGFDRFFRSKPVGILLLSLAGTGIPCLIYGFAIEPTRLTVTTYTLETPKLSPGQHVRIVHLADLHIRTRGPREKALPDLVRSLNPDLILHTGDFFGAKGDIEPIIVELLKSWHVPQYACDGNLDSCGDFVDTMRKAGVHTSPGACFEEQVRGIRIGVATFMPGADTLMPHVLQAMPQDSFNIVLYHYPCGFPGAWNTQADLMLAGHTHGGQIRMPGYGALITLDRYGKRWESGHYHEHDMDLIVSRGIGCEPFAPEVRFLCRPEIVVIDLIGAHRVNLQKAI